MQLLTLVPDLDSYKKSEGTYIFYFIFNLEILLQLQYKVRQDIFDGTY